MRLEVRPGDNSGIVPVRLSIPDDVIFEVLEDEAVLLKLNSGIYFSLNKTGTVAWRLIEEWGDLDRVKEAMRQRYPGPAAVIAKDVSTLVDALLEKGLLVAKESV